MTGVKRKFNAVKTVSDYQGWKRHKATMAPRRVVYPRSYSRASSPEKKVINTTVTSVGCNTTGTVTLLNGVATGTDFTDRVGRKIVNTVVQVRGFLIPDTTTASTTTNCCRVLVIEDLQTNGVAPTIASIFHEATGTSFMNLNNRNRFRVLMDEQFVIGPINTTATTTLSPCPSSHSINFYKKCNIPTVFEGTDATVASISEGALWLVTLSNQPAGANDATFTFSSRVRFIDA